MCLDAAPTSSSWEEGTDHLQLSGAGHTWAVGHRGKAELGTLSELHAQTAPGWDSALKIMVDH